MNNNHNHKKVENGHGALKAGIAAAAVAAVAGALFIYGTDEGKHAKKQIKGFALKAKGEVLEQIENLKHIDKEKYMKIVDGVMKKYHKKMKLSTKEIEALSKDIKKHWTIIAKKHNL